MMVNEPVPGSALFGDLLPYAIEERLRVTVLREHGRGEKGD